MGQTGSFPGAAMGHETGTPAAAAPSSAASNPGSSNAGLYASMGISAITSLGTAYSQSVAMKAQGEYQKSVADTNAKISKLEATEAIEQGDVAASRKNTEGRMAVGAVRAIQGASGVDVASGSSALTRIGTDLSGRIDELTIRNNAMRKAWGYKTQAIIDTASGQMSKMTAANEAQQTLLSGGIGAIAGPLAIESNYLRWSRSMGGSGGPGIPYPTPGSTPYVGVGRAPTDTLEGPF